MTLRLITAPTVEPVTQAEVMRWSRIDASGESPDPVDTIIGMLIPAARKVAENITGRGLITQTWELVLDKFPCNEIEIGMLPIQSITSLKYYDSAGVLQTMSSANYVLDADTLPGWVLPAYGFTWPSTYDIAQAVIIRFVSGYGAAGSLVPAEIKMWISAQCAAAYNNPDALMDGKYACLPFLDGLLDAYRIKWL
jgi:uncharacterized phiE125 gp8 family phage protein